MSEIALRETRRTRLGIGLAARLFGILDRLGQVFMIFLVATILLFTGGQAIDRYLVHSTFDAYEQIARVGVVWLTFFGYALGYRDRENLRVELLDAALPRRVVLAKRLIYDLGVLGLALLMHVKGWRVMEVGSSQVILGTPFDYSLVYGGLQFSTALLVAFAAVRTLRNLLALVDGGAPANPEPRA